MTKFKIKIFKIELKFSLENLKLRLSFNYLIFWGI